MTLKQEDQVSAIENGLKFEDNNPNINSLNLLNESNNNQGIYFMMQTPIDLVTPVAAAASASQLNSANHLQTLKLKLSPTLTALPSQYTANILTTTTATPATTTVTLNSPIHSSTSSSSSATSNNNSPKIVRDERRRANHNEVERRRRDNINKWIVELSKVIPDCSNDQSKHGQVR
jgi:hypothetical protein